MRTFRRLYGDSPWQLLVLLASFVVSGYAASRVIGTPNAIRIAVWFLGAAIVFDLVLSPLLALADRGLVALRRRPRAPETGARAVSPVNYVRVPVLFSGLLLLIFTPNIFQRSEPAYQNASGLTQDPYLERWVVVTLLIFAVSAVAYAATALQASRGPS